MKTKKLLNSLQRPMLVILLLITIFNCKKDDIEDPVSPPDTGTIVEIEAKNDSYTIEAGAILEIDDSKGLAANDTFNTKTPIFSVSEAPKNGELSIKNDGSFTYKPKSGFTGQDTFIYELNADEQKVNATVNITVVSNETDGGFSVFEPSEDSRVIYVSSSEGDDSNDCLSSGKPCKTIQEGMKKLRMGYPDHLLLKRGDIWTLENRDLDPLTSGRSKDEPMVFSYYGNTGPRPIIQGEKEVYRYDRSDGRKHMRWVGLHFYAHKKDPLSPNFDPTTGSPNLRFIGLFNDIHIEDVKFDHTEITIQQNKRSMQRPTDFRIKRNIFYGGYANGSSYERGPRSTHIYADGVDNGLLIEENVFDTGGWSPFVTGAGANLLSHNLYLQHDSEGNKIKFINNICTRASSHGIQMRSGGLVKDNFFARNAIGVLMGYNYGGREIPAGTIAHVYDNVISEGASMFGRGAEPCQADNNCTGALWGIDMNVNSEADYQAKDNIISMIAPEDYYIHKNTRITSEVLKIKVPDGNTVKAGKTLNRIGFKENVKTRDYPKSGNKIYGWRTVDQGNDQNYVDPTRTLADYSQSIGGGNNFDDFIQTIVNRPLGTWDSRYDAKSINNFIREGFKKK